MTEICKKEKCTACYACFNVCRKNAIVFNKDEYGALSPEIDKNRCVDCGMCVRVCPNNNARNFLVPKKCYAAYSVDAEKRRFSASGGIATVLAEQIITEGGVFYGAKYTDKFEVIFEETQEKNELEEFKGSKYVHSHVKDSLTKIKQRLDAGLKVLFIALPCQIAGLKFFLAKEYENLVTIDLICHGVSPSEYLSSEISCISRKNRAKVASCMFRNNAGSNYCFVLVNSNKAIVYRKPAYVNPYFRAFLQAISLRENCYTCDYARKERVSDITIGDFIGLGRDVPFDGNAHNASVVIINTEKGERFYSRCVENNKTLVSLERDYNEAVKYGPSLNAPFVKHPLYDIFRKNYKQFGFAAGIRKTLRLDIFKTQLKRVIYILTHFYKIPKKLAERFA